jgi:hypothetical protein
MNLAPPELKARKWHKQVKVFGQLQIPTWIPVNQQSPNPILQKGKFATDSGKRRKKARDFNPEAPITRRVRQRYSAALDPTFNNVGLTEQPAEAGMAPLPAAPNVSPIQADARETVLTPAVSAPPPGSDQPFAQSTITSKASLLHTVRNTCRQDSLDEFVDPAYDNPSENQ